MEHLLTEEDFQHYLEDRRRHINASLESYFKKVLSDVKDNNMYPIVDWIIIKSTELKQES